MELRYAVEQSSTDRLTFYLRPNLAPVYDGHADAYAASLCHAFSNPSVRVRKMDEWLETEAQRMLNGHAIGIWCEQDDRKSRILINLSSVPSTNVIRLRFISAADAALFKLTFS